MKFELILSLTLGVVTLPNWLAVVVGIAFVACLATSWHATHALRELKPRYDPGQHLLKLQKLAAQSQEWLELTDRTNGIKAAVFGITGVLLGAVGGLSADWVANGTWAFDNTVRAICVIIALLGPTAVFFWAIYKWKPKNPDLLSQSRGSGPAAPAGAKRKR